MHCDRVGVQIGQEFCRVTFRSETVKPLINFFYEMSFSTSDSQFAERHSRDTEPRRLGR